METRLLNGEEKLAWLEHHVMELDSVIQELHTQMAGMRKELLRLQEQQAKAPDPVEAPMQYEVPPHY